MSVSGKSPGLLSGMTVTGERDIRDPDGGTRLTVSDASADSLRRLRGDRRGAADVAALIVIVPLAFGAVLLFIYVGRQGTAREEVTHAAAVAARAASMERDAGAAQAAAAAAASRPRRLRDSVRRRAERRGVGQRVGGRWRRDGVGDLPGAGRGRDRCADADAVGVGAGDDRQLRAVRGLRDGDAAASPSTTSGAPATWPRSSCCSRCCSSPASASSSTRRASSPPIESARRSPWRRRGRAPTPSTPTCSATARCRPTRPRRKRRRPPPRVHSCRAPAATLQSVSVSGNRVTVVVTASVSPWFPLMSGRTVSKTATASAERDGDVAKGADGWQRHFDPRCWAWQWRSSSVAAAATAKDRRPTDEHDDDDDDRGADDDARSLAAEEAAVSEAAEQARLARLNALINLDDPAAIAALDQYYVAGQPGSDRRLTSRLRTSETRAGGSGHIRRFRSRSTVEQVVSLTVHRRREADVGCLRRRLRDRLRAERRARRRRRRSSTTSSTRTVRLPHGEGRRVVEAGERRGRRELGGSD